MGLIYFYIPCVSCCFLLHSFNNTGNAVIYFLTFFLFFVVQLDVYDGKTSGEGMLMLKGVCNGNGWSDMLLEEFLLVACFGRK